MLTARKVRVHVRNKNRYNVETRNCKLLYVEVNDFAGTTIGDIKEVRKFDKLIIFVLKNIRN